MFVSALNAWGKSPITADEHRRINVRIAGSRLLQLLAQSASVVTVLDVKNLIRSTGLFSRGSSFFLRHDGHCLKDCEPAPSNCGPENPIQLDLRVLGGGGSDTGESAGAGASVDDSYIKTAALRKLLLCRGQPTKVAIRLMRASYVMTQSNRRVARRQELEEADEEVFAGEEMLDRALEEVAEIAANEEPECFYPAIVVVSYCWESVEHPDPGGKQFAMMQKMIRWYMANRAKMGKDPDFCMFVDFHSLYQGADRTGEQLELFTEGLHHMDVLYGHRGTMVWIMSKPPDTVAADPSRGSYHQRGWTTFEHRVSSLAKTGGHVLDMGHFELKARKAGEKLMDGSAQDFLALSPTQLKALADPSERHDPHEGFLATLVRGRSTPIHPTAFAELVKTKTFSNESDKAIVAGLFEKVATAVLGSLEHAMFALVNFDTEQLEVLAGAVSLCTNARELNLTGCGVTSAGLAAFARALPPNVLPALEELDLVANTLGEEEGLAELGSALARGAMPRLKFLCLGFCGITSAGLTAFARALPPNALAALEGIQLQDNALGKEGWLELGAAVRRGAMPRLIEVIGISASGAAALRAAVPDREWSFQGEGDPCLPAACRHAVCTVM